MRFGSSRSHWIRCERLVLRRPFSSGTDDDAGCRYRRKVVRQVPVTVGNWVVRTLEAPNSVVSEGQLLRTVLLNEQGMGTNFFQWGCVRKQALEARFHPLFRGVWCGAPGSRRGV